MNVPDILVGLAVLGASTAWYGFCSVRSGGTLGARLLRDQPAAPSETSADETMDAP